MRPPSRRHPTPPARAALLCLGLGLLVAGACGGEDGRRPEPDAPALDVALRTRLRRAAQAPREEHAFARHRGAVASVHRLPASGGHILTTSFHGHAAIWAPTGEEVAVLAGHTDVVHDAVVRDDGRRILTLSHDRTARLWDADGAPVAVLHGHEEPIEAAAFSADGTSILTAALDGTARLWTDRGEPLTVLDPRPAFVEQACFLEGEARIAVVTRTAGVWIFDHEGRVRSRVEPDVDYVTRIVPAARGGLFAALTPHADVEVFDARGRSVARLEGHGAMVLDAAFSPDGAHLLTASLDGTARLWTSEGRSLATLRGHDAAVHTARFSTDGRLALTVGSDGQARLWDVDGTPIAGVGDREHAVLDAGFTPDGGAFYTLPQAHGPVRLYDLRGRALDVLPAVGGRPLAVRFGESWVVTLHVDATPRAWTREAPTGLVDGAPLADDGPRGLDADAPPERLDFTGAVACAPCHREAYEAWAASSHARTVVTATPAEMPPPVRDGETVLHDPGWTRFHAQDAGFVAETPGTDGAPTRYRLTHATGNRRVRMFLATLPDERLQVLPGMMEMETGVWFDYTDLMFGAGTAPGERPAVGPGHPSFWTGPVRDFHSRCGQCHVSGSRARLRATEDVGPWATWRAIAVDCEACHGPGRRHVEAWRRMEMDAQFSRLQDLPRDQKVAACTRCHMEGELLAPDWSPDMDLYEYLDPTLATSPERADPAGRQLELIYDGLPFGLSRCAEEGGLTCSFCHAPHGSEVRGLLRGPHEDGRFCVACHEAYVTDPTPHTGHEATSVGSQCTACHMPKLTIERGHGVITDHTIGIPRLAGTPADRLAQDACRWCHQKGRGAPPDMPHIEDDRLAAFYAQTWTGRGWPRTWMAALGGARATGTNDGLLDLLRDRAAPRLARASAAALLRGDDAEAVEAMFEASRDDDSLVRRRGVAALAAVRSPEADARLLESLSDPSAAVRTAAARAALQGWERVQANRALLEAAAVVLDADARRRPDDEIRWFLAGAAYDLLGDKRRALEAYEQRVRLDPFAHAVRRHVESLRAELGEDAE